MGCDIHMVLEQKDEVSGEWVGINDIPYIEGLNWEIRSRNYEFFAALAGVRGDGPEPLGMPSDASSLTILRLQSWGTDAHSISHLPAEEFLKRFCSGILRSGGQAAAAHEIKNMLEGSWYADALNKYFNVSIYSELPPPPLRVVFWFDN